MGRKPKPETLHRLQNTYRKDRANKNSPKVKSVLVLEKMLELEGDAADAWDIITGEMAIMGMLSIADILMITATSMVWKEFVQAARELEDEGRTVDRLDSDGIAIAQQNHPAVARFNANFRNLRSAISELGLSPASRERLTVKDDHEKDPIDEIAKRRELKNSKEVKAQSTRKTKRKG